MRESYKRFVKTWIRFANPCIVVTNPTSQIRKSGFASPNLKDSNCGFVSWPELPKIQPVFTNPTNPHESWRILSTIAWNISLQIQAGGFANPDSRIWTLKICIANLFCRPVFQRFVLWIRFVRSKIPNYSICFVAEGFVYESRILNYNICRRIRRIILINCTYFLWGNIRIWVLQKISSNC
jgi:hypothetical protein